jgi:hypothetical protein
MSYDENDDESGYDQWIEDGNHKLMEKKIFVDLCRESYELIRTNGTDAIEGENSQTVNKALSRMLKVFEDLEEFEKCSYLKEFAKDNLGVVLKPLQVEER